MKGYSTTKKGGSKSLAKLKNDMPGSSKPLNKLKPAVPGSGSGKGLDNMKCNWC